MICVHYNMRTGEVLGAYNSNMEGIPTPYIQVTEECWNKFDGINKKVDLASQSLKSVDIKPQSVNNTQLTDDGIDELRRQAYIKEADPLFFKYQRKECKKSDWTNKIKEIKKRYPKSDD